MSYLLDTNHWSFLQSGVQSVVERIASLPPSSHLYMPVIAQGKLLAGIHLVDSERRRAELYCNAS